MSIEVHSFGGGSISAPVIMCDTCGERIKKDGCAFWFELGSIRYTHKGECSKKFVDACIGWEELDRWMSQLCHNTKIKIRSLGVLEEVVEEAAK